MPLDTEYKDFEREVDEKFAGLKNFMTSSEINHLGQCMGELESLSKAWKRLPDWRQEQAEELLEDTRRDLQKIFATAAEREEAAWEAWEAGLKAEKERIERVSSPALLRDLPVRAKPLGAKKGSKPCP